MGLSERLNQVKAATAPGTATVQAPDNHTDQLDGVKDRLHCAIIDELNQKAAQKNGAEPKGSQQEQIRGLIEQAVENENEINRAEKSRVVKELLDDMLGLGPLEPLLADPTVSEIMVNGPAQIYVERHGKLERAPVRFRDSEHVMNIIDRIVSSIGRHVDEASPMVDARLQDGSRVNVVIPPLALKGPTVTIRKFSKIPLTIQDIVRFGSLSPKMARFLECCVKGKANLIVSGGTGSGKTTLLNILSFYIPDSERIITIEDAAELQLRQEHVVTLESRPANLEGRGLIGIRDLVRNALRMRPDRIVVGEVRSGEALDMLQAMNTGHEGSLTTAHANSPRDLLSRLETMVLMAGMELPVRAIREQIASALDIIVQQARMRDGSRRIVRITEVLGMESDVITLQDLYKFENEGVDAAGRVRGRFRPTGVRPHCLEKLQNNGVSVGPDLFVD